MTPKSPEQRVLDDLVEAVRSHPLPDVQTSALEEQLRQQWLIVIEHERRRARAKALFLRWTPVAVAAAVMLVAGVATFRHLSDPAPVPLRTSGTQSVGGSHLREGRTFVTETSSLTVTHAGRATWTLAPWSRAKIVELSPCLTLSLEAGRIDAEVPPSPQSETFAIETSTHRVAVHGTQFAVQLEPNELSVHVSSGAVRVSRRDQVGPDEKALLTAPQRRRFPLQEPVPIPSVATRVPLAHTTHDRSRLPSAHVEPALPPNGQVTPSTEGPEHPTALEQETALDLVRAAAARCFVQSAAADVDPPSDLRVRVETQLTLVIAPHGNLTEISFEPPVPAAISDCTQRELIGWSATPSQLGARPSRAIILVK